jgi:hypothetical protein
MTCHALDDVDLSVDVDGPVVTIRTRAEATIWAGGHDAWPLRLRIDSDNIGSAWRASDTLASTWR